MSRWHTPCVRNSLTETQFLPSQIISLITTVIFSHVLLPTEVLGVPRAVMYPIHFILYRMSVQSVTWIVSSTKMQRGNDRPYSLIILLSSFGNTSPIQYCREEEGFAADFFQMSATSNHTTLPRRQNSSFSPSWELTFRTASAFSMSCTGMWSVFVRYFA